MYGFNLVDCAPGGDQRFVCEAERQRRGFVSHFVCVCVCVVSVEMFARVLVLLALLAAVFAAIDEHKVIMCVLVPPVFLLN
jgi:hypothetical protein